MSDDLRSKYFKILGDTYKEYGFPPLCGWIEGLLALEGKELMQAEISEKLTEILHENAATSISSVNRAIKTLESYGSVVKTGNPKIGFKYGINATPELFEIFLQNFLNINRRNLRILKKLKKKAVEVNDTKLINGLDFEIRYGDLMANFLSESKKLFKEHLNKERKDL